MATGVREPDTSVATATKPMEQAPQALDADPCEGKFDDRCPSLSALRQSTGHRPASTVTNTATSRTQTRVSFATTQNLCGDDPTSRAVRLGGSTGRRAMHLRPSVRGRKTDDGVRDRWAGRERRADP